MAVKRTLTEVPAEIQRAIVAAKEAAKNAHCPYSRFAVGAAVVTDSGRVFSGCNVENAAYPDSMCAERVALYKAVSEGARSFRAFVVHTPTVTPTAPCGSCRQVIHEFSPDAEILAVCDGPDHLRFQLSELLPHAFALRDLGGR